MNTTAPQPPKSHFYARTVALATAVLLGGICLRIMAPFATALGWAIFFAFLVYPLYLKLRRKLRRHADHAAWLLTLATSAALLGPLAWLSALFVTQANNLLIQLQSRFDQNDLQQLSQQPWLQQPLYWLQRTFSISKAQLQTWFTEATHSVLQLLASTGGQLFFGTLGTLGNLFLTLFLMYFFVRDGERMVETVRNLIPMRPTARDALFEHLSAVTRAVIYGTGLTALIQGALVGVAFLITGLPSPVVFGVIAALLALLPVGGTALIWIPAALLLFANQRWGAGIFMLVWGALLVSMIDNFLKPVLISGRAEVATLTVFLGVLGGVAAFGALGLILGPVILSLALALIHFTVAQRTANATSAATESHD